MDEKIKLYRQTETKNYLFLLHGFTGSVFDWEETAAHIDPRYNVAAISLPGHDDNLPTGTFSYSEKGIVDYIKDCIQSITTEKVVLLGYSMGGRAALSLSVNYPDLVKGLILESTSPGINEKPEREKRILEDEELAQYIEDNSIADFIDYWYNKPLFYGMKHNEEKFQTLLKMKLQLDKSGLVKSLKGFGTGRFNLWKKIEEIRIPIMLLTGDRDVKFCRINGKMNKLMEDADYITVESGHNIHFENPEEFVKHVNNFFAKYLLF